MVSVFSIGNFNGSGFATFGLLCRANLAFPFVSDVVLNDPNHASNIGAICEIVHSSWLREANEIGIPPKTQPHSRRR
jgi:hypothetical protein